MDLMKMEVLKLLESDISAYRISKDTGVSESVIKKLRNQNQQLEDTKFETVSKLYSYAMKNQSKISENELKDIKLPKAVLTFIEEIASRIENINQKGAVKNVYVFDKYHMDDNGNSENKNSFIEINETISLPLQYNYHDEIPYQVHITKEINSKRNIDTIKGMTLLFKKDALINDLKIHIKNGSKVKMKSSDNKIPLMWNNNSNKGIFVNDIFNNSETYNFESSYFDFTFNKQIDTGNFPITLIKNEQSRLLLGYGMSNNNSEITMVVGKDNNDNPVTIDLENSPHLLVGGSIGSGTNTAMDYLITSLMWNGDIQRLQMAFIDVMGSAFYKYEKNPFNMTSVINKIEDIETLFDELIIKVNQRYKKMSSENTKDINEYNRMIEDNIKRNGTLETEETYMKRTIVFINGFVALENQAIEKKLKRILQIGRASGIHVILINGNLTKDNYYISGTLKNNIPHRLAYKVNEKAISMMMLNQYGAENLKGKGQGLLTINHEFEEKDIELVQTPFISEEEIEDIITYMNKNMVIEGDD
ncbi:FtsK/SpoIIIE domain-containing protein [Staphylococcus caprae]|uniref:FtsK/SpoIIIE domain-containing protein n=1 Tax=Staphylococcus caprae TaxID=29380 RepID=UPI003B21FF85